MFSKFRRLVGLVVIGGLVAAAASASASTVTISPGGSTTRTATTGSQISLNTARRTINCTTSTARFTLPTAPFSFSAFPVTISTDLVPAFSTCTLTGGLRPAVACGTSTLSVTGFTSGSVTPGSITGINCTYSLSATCSARVTGSITGSYSNTSGQMTVNSPTGQALASTGSTCTPLPNDTSVTFGKTGGGNLSYTASPKQTIDVTP